MPKKVVPRSFAKVPPLQQDWFVSPSFGSPLGFEPSKTHRFGVVKELKIFQRIFVLIVFNDIFRYADICFIFMV